MSMGDYPSMDAQLKTGEIRTKIDQEQKEADLINQKL